MILVFIAPFIAAGLAIAYIWGIKPAIDRRINNTDTIEKHYDKH